MLLTKPSRLRSCVARVLCPSFASVGTDFVGSADWGEGAAFNFFRVRHKLRQHRPITLVFQRIDARRGREGLPDAALLPSVTAIASNVEVVGQQFIVKRKRWLTLS